MKQSIEIPIILRRVKIEGPLGYREIDMILDSGAMYSSISWDVAKDIGYDPAVSLRRTPVITANGVIEVPLLTITRISMGELEAKNVDVICHDIPEIVEIEGLLGLSFLKNFRTVLDYKTGTLEID